MHTGAGQYLPFAVMVRSPTRRLIVGRKINAQAKLAWAILKLRVAAEYCQLVRANRDVPAPQAVNVASSTAPRRMHTNGDANGGDFGRTNSDHCMLCQRRSSRVRFD